MRCSLVFFFGLLSGVCGPESAVSGDEQSLVADAQGHDFGEVFYGELLTHTFTITNQGTRDITLERVKHTCKCATSRMWIGDEILDDDTISRRKPVGVLHPGESTRLEVIVDLSGETEHIEGSKGLLRKQVEIHNDGRDVSPLMLGISAAIRPAFELETECLDFGPVKRGESRVLSTHLWSTSIDHYSVTGVDAPSGFGASWTEAEGGTEEQPRYRVDVNVVPEVPPGQVSKAVTVKLFHPRVREVRIPVKALFLSDVSFLGNQPGSVDVLDFGTITGEEDSSVELHIVNANPDKPYVPERIELSARPVSDSFRQELIEIRKGAEYKIRVTATKGIAARYFQGILVIHSSHADLPKKAIRFKGLVQPK